MTKNWLSELYQKSIFYFFSIIYIKLENSFENDAIIFTDMKSKSLILKDDDKKLLKFNFGQFKYLGIWSSIGADFVCFEPWYNTPDYINSTKDFKEKKDIIELEPGKEFNINFSVEFY